MSRKAESSPWSNNGGKRPGAGRKQEVKAGVRRGIFIAEEDLKTLQQFKIPSLSEFYRIAGRKEIERMKKSQQKMQLE